MFSYKFNILKKMRISLFQKSIIIIIVLFGTVLSAFIFSSALLGYYQSMISKLNLAPVGSISVDENPRVGEITEITIKGTLCCPCYSIYAHVISKIDLINKEIQIYLWQEKGSEVCFMITAPYEYPIKIVFFLGGYWTIKINSKIFYLNILS